MSMSHFNMAFSAIAFTFGPLLDTECDRRYILYRSDPLIAIDASARKPRKFHITLVNFAQFIIMNLSEAILVFRCEHFTVRLLTSRPSVLVRSTGHTMNPQEAHA